MFSLKISDKDVDGDCTNKIRCYILENLLVEDDTFSLKSYINNFLYYYNPTSDIWPFLDKKRKKYIMQ